jgi:hypothetical protein
VPWRAPTFRSVAPGVLAASKIDPETAGGDCPTDGQFAPRVNSPSGRASARTVCSLPGTRLRSLS